MTLTFYHSRFCPRCRKSRKNLEIFLAAHPEINLREVEVTREPLTAFKEGIRMIPACRLGEKKVSGFILTPEKLAQLLMES